MPQPSSLARKPIPAPPRPVPQLLNRLGLSGSHDIRRGQAGHIEVQSEVDVGTTFSLYLPLTPLAQA